MCRKYRLPGQPCNTNNGHPSRTPHSAYAIVLPSGAVTNAVSTICPTPKPHDTTASSASLRCRPKDRHEQTGSNGSTVQHRGCLARDVGPLGDPRPSEARIPACARVRASVRGMICIAQPYGTVRSQVVYARADRQLEVGRTD